MTFGLPSLVGILSFYLLQVVAYVKSISPVTRDCGSWKFPGFTLDREFEFGMSGAAVFYDDALVGIFSGPDYVASLWPLAVHHYIDREKSQHAMAELFESGAIRVRDWAAVNGKVGRVSCSETGNEEPGSKSTSF